MTNGLKATAVFAVATVMAPTAYGQMTGVSHPDQVPVQTTVTAGPDGSSATVVYQPYQPTPTLIPDGGSATIVYQPYQPTPAATVKAMRLMTRPEDGLVVGDNSPTGLQSRAVSVDRSQELTVRAETREYVSVGPGRNMDGEIVTDVDGPANELPVGTLMKARIVEQLRSNEAVIGRDFTAELSEPVERNGRVLLPPGAMIKGRVTDAHSGRRISGSASLHLQPTEIILPDGVRYRITAQVVDTSIYNHVKVDQEGTILRRDHAGETLAVLGLASGAGVVTGAVIAGVPGAVVGGLVGAGVGTTVWLKQNRQAEVPAGTGIVFSLNQALTVGPE